MDNFGRGFDYGFGRAAGEGCFGCGFLLGLAALVALAALVCAKFGG